MTLSLPECAEARSGYPMADGLLDYFPNALAYVSLVSKDGNEQHNPGKPLHWDRSKSRDHRNKLIRHAIDYDQKDERGIYHAGRAAWRALALLQELLEAKEGCPVPRGAKAIPHDDGDWRDWYGGECPLAPQQLVEVRYLHGMGFVGRAGSIFWGRGRMNGSDVVAYRVVGEAE